jgi:hypothetical protein
MLSKVRRCPHEGIMQGLSSRFTSSKVEDRIKSTIIPFTVGSAQSWQY